jgi:hypothetical protein
MWHFILVGLLFFFSFFYFVHTQLSNANEKIRGLKEKPTGVKITGAKTTSNNEKNTKIRAISKQWDVSPPTVLTDKVYPWTEPPAVTENAKSHPFIGVANENSDYYDASLSGNASAPFGLGSLTKGGGSLDYRYQNTLSEIEMFSGNKTDFLWVYAKNWPGYLFGKLRLPSGMLITGTGTLLDRQIFPIVQEGSRPGVFLIKTYPLVVPDLVKDWHGNQGQMQILD